MPRGPRSFSSLLFGAPESKQTLVLIFLLFFSSVKGLWIVVASCFFILAGAGAVSLISPLSSGLYGIGFGPYLLCCCIISCDQEGGGEVVVVVEEEGEKEKKRREGK
jgi:hypothetical protein